MSKVLAIYPGNERSVYVVLKGGIPIQFGIEDNAAILERLKPPVQGVPGNLRICNVLAIEMIASYGMPVGREVFDTCVFIGRCIQAWDGPSKLVYRQEVKLNLCGQARAKDGNVRQALIDRFGGKLLAIGNAASKGVLYGMSKDVWLALAVACTYFDQQRSEAA